MTSSNLRSDLLRLRILRTNLDKCDGLLDLRDRRRSHPSQESSPQLVLDAQHVWISLCEALRRRCLRSQ